MPDSKGLLHLPGRLNICRERQGLGVFGNRPSQIKMLQPLVPADSLPTHTHVNENVTRFMLRHRCRLSQWAVDDRWSLRALLPCASSPLPFKLLLVVAFKASLDPLHHLVT
jgi:hypothetical protein